MKPRRVLLALLALALGGSIGDPRTRGRLLLAVSKAAGSGANALRSLQIAAGARYIDLAFPPAGDVATVEPAAE